MKDYDTAWTDAEVYNCPKCEGPVEMFDDKWACHDCDFEAEIGEF